MRVYNTFFFFFSILENNVSIVSVYLCFMVLFYTFTDDYLASHFLFKRLSGVTRKKTCNIERLLHVMDETAHL